MSGFCTIMANTKPGHMARDRRVAISCRKPYISMATRTVTIAAGTVSKVISGWMIVVREGKMGYSPPLAGEGGFRHDWGLIEPEIIIVFYTIILSCSTPVTWYYDSAGINLFWENYLITASLFVFPGSNTKLFFAIYLWDFCDMLREDQENILCSGHGIF